MQRLLRILTALVAIGVGSADIAFADEPVVVVVSSQTRGVDLDLATLRTVYLKKLFLDKAGESLVPVNLPADDPLRQAFTSTVIHMDALQLRNYWNRRYFQGVSPPYVLGSQQAVIRFIATTPGAIGYISPCLVDSRVRIVMRLELPTDGAAATACTPGS